MKQLPLNLTLRVAQDGDEFIVTPCNEMAASMVESWPSWSGQMRALNVTGAALSGKSHLGAVWQHVSHASLISRLDEMVMADTTEQKHFLLDNVRPGPEWDDEQLFLLLTRIKDENGSVMILSQTPISQMEWSLPDLRSRLRAFNLARIGTPDDELITLLLEKYFADRQLAVPDTVLQYVVARIERSFQSVSDVVEDMDQQALATKKKVSLGLARDVLARQASGKVEIC